MKHMTLSYLYFYYYILKRYLHAWYKPFIRYVFCKFLPNPWLVFLIFLTRALEEQKFFIVKFNLWMFLYVVCAFNVVSKKSLPNLRSQRFSPMCLSRSIVVITLTLWSIFTEWHEVWLMGHYFVPATFAENIIPSPFNTLSFLWKINWPYTWGSISHSLLHWFVCFTWTTLWWLW